MADKPQKPEDDQDDLPSRGRGYGSYGNYGNYGGGYGGGYGYGAGYGQGGYGRYGLKEGGNPLYAYIAMIRERFWWLILSVLVGITLALVVTYQRMPEYRAVGKLRIFRMAPEVTGNNTAANNNFNIITNDDFFTAVETMRSTAIIESVSRALTIAEKKQVIEPYQQGNVFSGPLSEQAVFARQRAINPLKSTFVVAVEFTHPDRELARQVAGIFCKSIQKNSEDERLNITNPLVEKLRSEIDLIEDRLRKLADKRSELIKSQKLLSIAKDTTTLTAERGVLVRNREDAQKQIDELDIIWKLILEYKKAGKDPYDIAQVRTDERVAALGPKVTELRVTVSTMEKKYTDEHPALIQTRAQLDQTNKELAQAVANSVNRIQASVQNARSSFNAIVANLERKDDEIYRLQAANNELERVDKEIRGQEEFLARQRQNYEEQRLRSSTAGTSTSIKIQEMPSVDLSPVNKNYAMNALTGMGLGLLVGFGLIVLIGSFDDRVKSTKDVEVGLGLPLLGAVPKVTEAVGPDRALLARQDKDRVATEAIRAIYSAMKVSPATANCRVFLVTSTRPGEGKTFVATNLALSFAQHAERVLIIDADLRLPNVGPSLGFSGDGGVSRWFNGEMTLDEAIVRDVAPGLDVLPVGMSCRNPTQVINNPKFLAMLDEMKQRYDRVFIDSPPIGAVSDSLHLVPKVDGVVYVVRFNLVHMRNAGSCLARLAETGVPILGAVLNRMSLRMASIYTDTYNSANKKYYIDAEGSDSND